MEAIDLFKYKALLAKLEPLKGKKKPVQDFIKEVHKLSNKLSNKDQPKTQMYAFILITRAMKYDGSARPIKWEIESYIRPAAERLIRSSVINSENVAEVFKYFTGTLNVYPNSTEELLRIDTFIDKLSIKYNLYYCYTKELKLTDYPQQVAKLILLSNNPDSTLAKTITDKPEHTEEVIKTLQQTIDLYLRILNEHNSSISTTE